MKGASSTTECITLYNQGSQWDGGSGCKCAQGYAGVANSFCTDCRRLGQVVSGTACAVCLGNTVLQNFICSECTNMVPSSDRLSCVTCSSRYGDGSIYSASGTCVCDTAYGFAGATNSVCIDCWRKGQAVSGTSCTACSGTAVLQSGVCAECPVQFVPSLDTISCITCSQRYGSGSIYSTIGTCICDNFNGFSGASNSICSYCWVLGKTISGTSCTSCSGTTVLQSGTCLECPDNLVPSADKLSCVLCASRYGEASSFVAYGLCRCTTFGFTGSDNSVCSDCLRMGQMISGATCASCFGTHVLQSGVCAECPANFVPSSDKLSCVTCVSLYGSGSSYSAVNTCVCQVSAGFGGADNSICEDCKRSGKEASNTGCTACAGDFVLQSGTCKACPIGSAQSLDKLSCVAQSVCQSNFGPGSFEFTPGTCRCQSSSGFAGADNRICVDCLRIGKFVSGTAGSTTCESCSNTQVLQSGVCAECPAKFVPSSDKLSCVTCSSKFGDGSVFLSTGICRCSDVLGFAGSDNDVCSDCWRQGKTVSGAAGATTCASCSGTHVLQSGVCAECPANFVPSSDKVSCVACSTKYGYGSTFVSQNQCKCTIDGFAGADNSACVDCWRLGKVVLGSQCVLCPPLQIFQQGTCQDVAVAVTCPGTEVFQGGKCQECPANYVPSLDKSTCVTCSSKFEYGSKYVSVGTCKCTQELGFYGADNIFCQDCWRNSQIIGQSGCTSCPSGRKFDPSTHTCEPITILSFLKTNLGGSQASRSSQSSFFC
ncbi:VSP [Hexamita inflata]|uniref:VSP n=1 Tax=Hexamita inflata TaxID=28002 RepID=A0AA86RLL1_9EUKA|nr:VSP [Hexamita inflata]